jgi:hypothetical protein
MKKILTSILLTICATTFAQIPSYVPSNGLVGWWPFNGNANDESGNGNNGTVNGATLTSDRNGVTNKAYNFDGIDDFIEVDINTTLPIGLSISVWINSNLPNSQFEHKGIVWSRLSGPSPNPPFPANQATGIMIHPDGILCTASDGNSIVQIQDTGQFYNDASWFHLVFTYEANSGLTKIFVNGIETISMQSLNLSPIDLAYNTIKIGKDEITGYGNRHWNGLIDDIGIWNRALSEVEIATLFSGCNLSVTTQPQDQNVTTSLGTASFSTATLSQTSSYQWQTNLGVGFQNLSNAGQYSGATSATLTVSSLSISNNNQVFRCIINEGVCVDTTSEAILTIIDDASVQSNTPSTFKLYPNPVKDELFIKGMLEAVLPFEVYSTDGKKVLSGTTSGSIDVGALKKGSYQLKMKEQTIPFVKQ